MAADDRGQWLRHLVEALDRSGPARRAALLDEACTEDPLLRAELEALLDPLTEVPTADVLPPLPLEILTASLVGSVVGRYRIVREIAEGGMGVVYLAERTDLGKRVALKLVRDGRLASSSQLRRFLRERRLLARLEHPNVARLMDAGVTGQGVPYLVMEYVDGLPIDRHCDLGRMPLGDRLRLFTRVCAAVEHAHQQRIVHRDLKPSNLLVTPAGEVKLLDFGIATLLEERAADPTLTRAGLIVATPAYAAPEQVRGERVTEAADVYALGVVLYELLSGSRPYALRGCTAAEVERIVCTVEPVPPSVAVLRPGASTPAGGARLVTPEAVAEARGTEPGQLRRQLAGALDDIVLRALAKAPADRYASAAALAEDIERHLAGLSPVARPAGGGRHRGRPLLVAAGVACGGLAVIAGQGTGPWSRGPADAAVRATASAGVESASHSTAIADLVAVNGWIDCRGHTPGPRVPHGAVTVRRTAAEELVVTVAVSDADPTHTYTIEIFEGAEECPGGSNAANTGFMVQTDATGRGVGEARLELPHRSLGGEVLADGRGSETLVVVLDRTLSTSSGDWFVATVPLPPTGPAADRVQQRDGAYRALREGNAPRAEHLFQLLTDSDPADVDSWLRLGQTRFRYGPVFGRSSVEAADAFERVLALQPGDLVALMYRARIAALGGEGEAVLATTARIAEIGGHRGIERGARALAAAVSSDPAELVGVLSEPPAGSADNVYLLTTVAVYAHDFDAAERLIRSMIRPSAGPEARALGHAMRADLALARGRRRDALAELDRVAQYAPFRALAMRELAAHLPLLAGSDAGAASRRRVLEAGYAKTRADTAFLYASYPQLADGIVRDYLLGRLAARTDPDAADRYALSLEGAAGAPPLRAVASALARSVRAHASWVEGDAAGTLRALGDPPPLPPLEFVPERIFNWTSERFLRAEALHQLGRSEEALRWYETIAELAVADLVYLAPAYLRQAEIHARLGNPHQAAEHYAHFLELWRDCDAELRPVRARAERALAALRGTPR